MVIGSEIWTGGRGIFSVNTDLYQEERKWGKHIVSLLGCLLMCITLNKESETSFEATKNFSTTRETTSPKMQCHFGPNASRNFVRNYISQNALLPRWFSFSPQKLDPDGAAFWESRSPSISLVGIWWRCLLN